MVGCCSEQDEGASSERLHSSVVALFNDLGAESSELNVDRVLLVRVTGLRSSPAAKLDHEDELLEDAEVHAPLAILCASVVHHVREQVVVIILRHSLEDVQGVLCKTESVIQEATLGTRCLFFGKLLQHVDTDFV